MIKQLLLWSKPFRYFLDQFAYNRMADHKPIISLKNRLKGQPILVVGNGPSLNRTPLDTFANISAIGMNKIDLIFSRVNWRPSLIICTNNLVIQQHKKKFIGSKIPVFLSWKGRWFINPWHRRKVNFFNSLLSSDFSTNLLKGVGSAGTVTYTALQFAYYMGCNPVILFGVDHNFSYSGQANEIQKRQGTDANHFDQNYFKSGSYWGVPNLEKSELGYKNAKDVFESDNRCIFDATIDGKLTIFPKISVDKAKELCGIG